MAEELSVIAHLGHRARLEAVVALGHLVRRLGEIPLQVVVAILQAHRDADLLTALAARGGRLLRQGRRADDEERRDQGYRTFHCFTP